jgi:hypothetical protein
VLFEQLRAACRVVREVQRQSGHNPQGRLQRSA